MDFLVLTKTGGILGPFATALGFIINYIYKGLEFIGIPNTALAIIIFTLLINLILLPLTIKQQKTSKMMTIMNPELQKIQAKYKGKRDDESVRRMQAETQAVYQKYGTSPTGGCLYMIIQLPILFALYQVIYRVPAYISSVNDLYMQIAAPISQVANGSEIITTMISELGLRVMNFDFSNMESIVDFLSSLKTVDWGILEGTTENAHALVNAFAGNPAVIDAAKTVGPQIMNANSIFGILNMSDLPTTGGWWPGVLIPVLSGVTQYISMKISTASQPQQDNSENPMNSSMKTMNAVMPLFSVFICFTFNIGIGVYWIANAVVRTVVMVAANKIIDKKGLDKIIQENKEKAKKKAEKRGDKPSKFEEYAKMSTKNYEESAKKKKSIKELASTSTMTAAEKSQMSKNQTVKASSVKNETEKSENKKPDLNLGKEKDLNTDDKKSGKESKKGKKGKEAENIASIAHMLDNNRRN